MKINGRCAVRDNWKCDIIFVGHPKNRPEPSGYRSELPRHRPDTAWNPLDHKMQLILFQFFIS